LQGFALARQVHFPFASLLQVTLRLAAIDHTDQLSPNADLAVLLQFCFDFFCAVSFSGAVPVA
jgi:hypothetical protein